MRQHSLNKTGTEKTLRTSGGDLLPYTLIRSSRRSIGVEITREEDIIVRAPVRTGITFIEQFLREHESWITAHLLKMQIRAQQTAEAALAPISRAELKSLADKALADIPPRVSHYASLIGVTYGRITIRNQTTLWGSCTAKGNLNFNCLLMKMPQEILDYVIVHELCHRLEMNHSARFWAKVAEFCPDYKEKRRWLKDNGNAYISAMKEGISASSQTGPQPRSK